MNGFVGAMVGGFELAGWLVMGVRAVVEVAVGKRAAEPFVKEQEEQGDLNPFWGETVGVAGSVTLQQPVGFELAQVVTELVQPVGAVGEVEADIPRIPGPSSAIFRLIVNWTGSSYTGAGLSGLFNLPDGAYIEWRRQVNPYLTNGALMQLWTCSGATCQGSSETGVEETDADMGAQCGSVVGPGGTANYSECSNAVNWAPPFNEAAIFYDGCSAGQLSTTLWVSRYRDATVSRPQPERLDHHLGRWCGCAYHGQPVNPYSVFPSSGNTGYNDRFVANLFCANFCSSSGKRHGAQRRLHSGLHAHRQLKICTMIKKLFFLVALLALYQSDPARAVVLDLANDTGPVTVMIKKLAALLAPYLAAAPSAPLSVQVAPPAAGGLQVVQSKMTVLYPQYPDLTYTYTLNLPQTITPGNSVFGGALFEWNKGNGATGGNLDTVMVGSERATIDDTNGWCCGPALVTFHLLNVQKPESTITVSSSTGGNFINESISFAEISGLPSTRRLMPILHNSCIYRQHQPRSRPVA